MILSLLRLPTTGYLSNNKNQTDLKMSLYLNNDVMLAILPHLDFRSKDTELHDDFDYHKFHCFRSPGR